MFIVQSLTNMLTNRQLSKEHDIEQMIAFAISRDSDWKVYFTISVLQWKNVKRGGGSCF